MTYKDLFIGETKLVTEPKEVQGESVIVDGERYYKISNVDGMRPFFMSIVSHSDHWMFISSNGGLTAGRRNSEQALFPYYTDDKITASADTTGSRTIIHVHGEDRTRLWEPFSNACLGSYKVQRNLYKSNTGNKIMFQEINSDLGLIFNYQWCFSEEFGFIKKSTLENSSGAPINCSVLDGIQNILPYGVPSALQNASSNLVNAYKRNELEADMGLGIYALSAIIVDKAEPSEALKATTVWSLGFDNAIYLVSSVQLDNFRRGGQLQQETDVKAESGAYFIGAEVALEPKQSKEWMIVAEVVQSRSDIALIRSKLADSKSVWNAIEKDIEDGTAKLVELVASSDGLQSTADKMRDARHFSNTLFNVMRGGIFDDGYHLEKSDFTNYIKKANTIVFDTHKSFLESWPEKFALEQLRQSIEKNDDPDLKRLALEYLPLRFSRRHGDPSRPWNRFSINTKNDDGTKILDYEGNWRDIFQNWEALSLSYPGFLESMISKFLNASTFDGYNPYRVTKDGFDWEVIEPDDPWSYIGYWGDHQIIYLLKLLELMESHYPNQLANAFEDAVFVYANVPYKIKGYEDILKNPKDTIEFDEKLDAQINREREKIGADAALLKSGSNGIYHVTLMEKILATMLSKLSNFIPEGGIWMNTQRPEWNDANNALVGNGVSMVTLCYLRRFLKFFETIITTSDEGAYQVSSELATFYHKVFETLNGNASLLQGKFSNKQRKAVMDGLGKAGAAYRNDIYTSGFSGDTTAVSHAELLGFVQLASEFLEHTIRANQRQDKLYHAYNLMTVENDTEVSLSHLSEMLEGQVAILSSGYLSASESLEVLDALKHSTLFREDQYSYLLYPNKDLPRFGEKNTVPNESVKDSKLLMELLKNGNTSILEQGVDGLYHFNGSFNNAAKLDHALDQLPKETYGALVKEERQQVLNIYEQIFDHKSFTGRSGTFFGYEGLGSIYWHMVSKLLLSVAETCVAAIQKDENEVVVGKLLEHFYEINEGIGVHKPPKLYGAFPTDPYSHTPANKGAQQPGMTGQVKEDILSRFMELGVFVAKGVLVFDPCLLRKEEFMDRPFEFDYVDVHGNHEKLTCPEQTLCFTYDQVPVVYTIAEKEHVQVKLKNGGAKNFEKLELDMETSVELFGRTGNIASIHVFLNAKRLR